MFGLGGEAARKKGEENSVKERNNSSLSRHKKKALQETDFSQSEELYETKAKKRQSTLAFRGTW